MKWGVHGVNANWSREKHAAARLQQGVQATHSNQVAVRIRRIMIPAEAEVLDRGTVDDQVKATWIKVEIEGIYLDEAEVRMLERKPHRHPVRGDHAQPAFDCHERKVAIARTKVESQARAGWDVGRHERVFDMPVTPEVRRRWLAQTRIRSGEPRPTARHQWLDHGAN
jgi:hypothetical protein